MANQKFSCIFIFVSLFLLNGSEAFVLKGNGRGDRFETRDVSLPLYLVDYATGALTEDNFRYTIPISVGTPVQEFNVHVNMRSADTWVAYISCQSLSDGCTEDCRAKCDKTCRQECCTATLFPCDVKEKFYDALSSNFKNLSDEWRPDQPYRGFYGSETVSLGSAQDMDLRQISKSNIEFATFITDDSTNSKFADGFFGLGFGALSTKPNATSVWESAFKQNLFDEQLFTISLKKEEPRVLGEVAGSLTFGAKYDVNPETIKYFNLLPGGYWAFQFTKTFLNKSPLSNNGPYKTIVDINEPYIRVPSSEFQDIVQKTHAVYDFRFDAYTLDCSVNFTWSFQSHTQRGEKVIELNSKDLMEKSPLGDCILRFDQQNNDKFDYTLGASFLKAFTGVFDYGNSRIGFGEPDL